MPGPVMWFVEQIYEMLRQLRNVFGTVSRGPRSVLIEHLGINIAALTFVETELRRPVEGHE
eukprot:5910535-Heterocapsa_arctica.AAC.1